MEEEVCETSEWVCKWMSKRVADQVSEKNQHSLRREVSGWASGWEREQWCEPVSEAGSEITYGQQAVEVEFLCQHTHSTASACCKSPPPKFTVEPPGCVSQLSIQPRQCLVNRVWKEKIVFLLLPARKQKISTRPAIHSIENDGFCACAMKCTLAVLSKAIWHLSKKVNERHKQRVRLSKRITGSPMEWLKGIQHEKHKATVDCAEHNKTALK